MVDILLAIGLILLALFVLVTIHELGHFGAAKLLKIRVDVFSIFFPPKLFSFKVGETTYQLGAIPVGGFVKIAGMIDESVDTEHLDKPVEQHEFRSRPVWQRFLVMVAGVVMNVFLAIVIFSTLKFFYGETRIPTTEIDKYGIQVSRAGAHIGLQDGDRIVSYNGEKPQFVEEMVSLLVLMEADAYYEVDRNGTQMRINVPDTLVDSMKCWKPEGAMFFPGIPPVVKVLDKFLPEGATDSLATPASNSGLQTGDRIVSIDGQATDAYHGIMGMLKDRAGDTLAITYERGGATNSMSVPIGTEGKLGIYPGAEWDKDTLKFGFFGAIAAGTKQSFGVVNQQLKGYRAIGSGKASLSQNMSGIIGIANTIVTTFRNLGWPGFWEMTGFLSMILAFVNILPIPALDGGHIMFLAWEGITGKEPSDKVKLIAQYVGLGIVLLLLVGTLGNDIVQIWFSGPDPCA